MIGSSHKLDVFLILVDRLVVEATAVVGSKDEDDLEEDEEGRLLILMVPAFLLGLLSADFFGEE